MPVSLFLLPTVSPLLIYQIAVSLFVLFSLGNALGDWVVFRRPTTILPESRTDWKSVSVLIPARNEAASIAACLDSLRRQNYAGDFEILVLNDRSEDETGGIVARFALADRRIKSIEGGDLRKGWKGKPNALRQLQQAATGELLLLTDADCVFAPHALTDAVNHREQTQADCLSLMPFLVCGSFWEHTVIPLQHLLIFLMLPVQNVWMSKNPAFAAANGAFILIDAKTYADLGGHNAVKGEMAEDIKFAQWVKKQGRRMVYADGSRIYRVRMYENLRGIWDGFSKNLFPAMGKSVPILILWSLFLLTTQVLPFVFVAAGLVLHNYSWAFFMLPLFHCGIALLIRTVVLCRFGQSFLYGWTHPVGWMIILSIAANSAYQSLSGKGHIWKGRVYRT